MRKGSMLSLVTKKQTSFEDLSFDEDESTLTRRHSARKSLSEAVKEINTPIKPLRRASLWETVRYFSWRTIPVLYKQKLFLFLLVALVVSFALINFITTTGTGSTMKNVRLEEKERTEAIGRLPKGMLNDKSGVNVSKMDVRISGFDFCTNLNNATFNKQVFYDSVDVSLNPNKAIEVIQEGARGIYRDFLDSVGWGNLYTTSMLRYACLMSAHGQNNVRSVFSSPFLKALDPAHHFPFLSLSRSAAVETTIINVPNTCQSALKPRYKMAYLIMVHDSFEPVKYIHGALNDPNSLIMIHVDGKNKDLYHTARDWLHQEDEAYKNCNTLLMSNPVSVLWGHSSMVFAQVEAFFQLLQIADWDYVTQLSSNDYPLRSPQEMHDILQKTPGKSYIQYWSEEKLYTERLKNPVLTNWDNNQVITFSQEREFVLEKDFTLYKHHQWMILSRDFVTKLRDSDSAMMLLAWMEHSWIPDEMFFATWGTSPTSGIKEEDLVNDMKRYLRFTNDIHPEWLTINDTLYLEEKDYFFARKIRVVEDEELRTWMDERRNQYQPDST